jgi:protein-L-isoaspartate(D-aspartate) O-methyltransferase
MNVRHRGIGMTSQRTRERLVKRLEEQGIHNIMVLDAIRQLPRHIFVDEALASRAYEDTALPIGYSQTISQPYIVARMTEALVETGPLDKVLEVGTGSGYQAAVMSYFARTVYTVERIEPLLMQARRRFIELGRRNIRTQYSDGNIGWVEHEPFDGIIVTAAPVEIPKSLLQQLQVGGRLITPVGQSGKQELVLITRTETGFEREILNSVSFVPMVSGTV